jgi:hypothetical protein
MKTVNPVSSSLLVGCSISDFCGFGQVGNHNDKRCWYNIVSDTLNITIDNHAFGGLSNLEILYRCSRQLLTNLYELVIVQLTSPQRKWLWRNFEADRYLIYNGGRVENAQNDIESKLVQDVCQRFFDEAHEVERDLVNLLMIQQFCNQKKMMLLIIDGMGFIRSAYKHCPALMAKLDKSQILGPSWMHQQIDYADDGQHPGILSNQQYADQVIKYLNMQQLKAKS